ncbi:Short chain enoyl-CoA hydratase [Fasciola gigantica]|uniref:Enoyl-CoA hydratase domain-containing protein 3, mitochondrial n=1 Tax=Fasciola gigantica TaxID=46835 RepID=A0A504YY73_FASGI|nr:Short chain enoyl-CoA hydratase [Fasciola gigantica]
MMRQLSGLSVPSIAAIRGPALAGGCQLVAACDLAVAGQSAIFSTPGVKLGLFCSTPAVPLVRAIGLRAAKELLLTGRTIKAQRAYELGLVHRVVPDDQVMDAALELAREITQHSKSVVAMGKQTLDKQAALDSVDEAYSVATQTMLENLELDDTQCGIRAFIQKKPMPKWKHKSN